MVISFQKEKPANSQPSDLASGNAAGSRDAKRPLDPSSVVVSTVLSDGVSRTRKSSRRKTKVSKESSDAASASSSSATSRKKSKSGKDEKTGDSADDKEEEEVPDAEDELVPETSIELKRVSISYDIGRLMF